MNVCSVVHRVETACDGAAWWERHPAMPIELARLRHEVYRYRRLVCVVHPPVWKIGETTRMVFIGQ